MEAKLSVVDGAKDKTIKLKLPMTIGRSKEASLKVPHSQVSRQHCEIYVEDGMLVVDDLGSSNGTFINDDRVNEPTFLYPGELLRVGKVTFAVEYEMPPESLPSQTEISTEESAENVMDESEAKSSAPSSESVLSYSENAEGSFLGIEEIETDQPATPQASSIGDFETGELPSDDQVDPGDSALNDFFKNLE